MFEINLQSLIFNANNSAMYAIEFKIHVLEKNFKKIRTLICTYRKRFGQWDMVLKTSPIKISTYTIWIPST